jgi:hypothetical protein
VEWSDHKTRISTLADLVSGCEERLEVVHDLFVLDIGGEQGRVDLLGEAAPFFLFQHVPFREILFQLLHLLLL